ncbi:MAG: ferrochelatase, partial [Longimicrobiales bacterium]
MIVEMKTGVVLLNFGEPEQPVEAEVVPFLERIFTMNASLEGTADVAQMRARSVELARKRAPALTAVYREIGGSPLNAQARSQADALRAELAERGRDVATYVGMQFTAPSIADAVAHARADGVRRLVGLPLYPLCGPTTTVAALATLADAVAEQGWNVELREIGGWHPHPLYAELRAEGIRRIAAENGLDLDTDAMLVFSAHGTPMRYLREGSRYDVYVRDSCARVARAAGAARYVIGYQNHTNRPVEWTQPDIDAAVRAAEAETVLVVPISFMHEQSETLAELDIDLRAAAEAAELRFFRVSVPHDDARFVEVLADLVEAALEGGLAACRCRAGARCLG